MSDYDKKINPKEHDPYENISAHRIEKDKKGKEEFSSHRQEPTKSQIFATLISYFKKLISLFSDKNRETLFLFENHELHKHLIIFRSQLQILSKQDESHNPAFTQQLTELWHNLLDDCNSLTASKEFSAQTISDIKFFISQVSNYPLGADHTLGYYFHAYAGKDWIPFPFMDLLKELHDEYRANPSTNHLTQWISLITDILEIHSA